MGIYKVKDRRGRLRYVVSKYWPNRSGRLRKYASQLPERTGASDSGGVQHFGRHLEASQAGDRRRKIRKSFMC